MATPNQTPNDAVVALDIGTTKICAIVGRRNQHGKIEILGVGKVESSGVLRGVVSNIEKTVNAIGDAVSLANRQAAIDTKLVHVGIAGQHIKSLQHRGLLTRHNDHIEIGQKDIDQLINDMHKLVLPPGDKIIHVIPQEFTVDNEQGIVDPIGMSGVRLEANFHIITGQITASNNIYRCVERCGMQVVDMTLEPIASAISVLSDEEREAGIALVDIGGGTTDITIFHDGIIRHTAVIPFGGNAITKDIKEGCTIMPDQAEKLKIRFGSALADEVVDNRIITIPGLKGRDHKEISEKNLVRIIQARLEEILDYVRYEIQQSGFERKLVGGIVLTGGGALMKNIEKITELHTGMSTRIGTPVEHLAHGYSEQLSSPIYSTAIGLLLKGIQEADRNTKRIILPLTPSIEATTPEPVLPKIEQVIQRKEERKPEKPMVAGTAAANNEQPANKWYENIFKRTKEWFEQEPDSGF